MWGLGGTVSLLLGSIGIILPLLPTVPFLLLSAFCFARSSEPAHVWLLSHRYFGPPILQWQEHGAISNTAKVLAMVSLIFVLGMSFLMQVPLYALLAQLVALICVACFILTRPSGASAPENALVPAPTESADLVPDTVMDSGTEFAGPINS
ncbi:MAG: YbaN family protein [Pseudomonadales bacterium]|nr:YbaN family protein [Pseudomonadales bacterium]